MDLQRLSSTYFYYEVWRSFTWWSFYFLFTTQIIFTLECEYIKAEVSIWKIHFGKISFKDIYLGFLEQGISFCSHMTLRVVAYAKWQRWSQSYQDLRRTHSTGSKLSFSLPPFPFLPRDHLLPLLSSSISLAFFIPSFSFLPYYFLLKLKNNRLGMQQYISSMHLAICLHVTITVFIDSMILLFYLNFP